MFTGRNIFSGKRKYLLGLLLFSFICIICAAFSRDDSNDFDFARREILLRRIGHELLLQSGDSISRVLPVEKVSNDEYLIRFENEFTFQPDSLLNVTRRFLDKAPFANNYIVNVLNCNNATVTYGYAISKNKEDNIVACLGRNQPKACYTISIKFKPANHSIVNNGYLLGSLSFLALAGFVLLLSFKPPKAKPYSQYENRLTLGSTVFDAENKKLIAQDTTIDLTGTETRLLHIFAMSPNEIIPKKRIQKEIWEDEGVIVGRSLDMFISKLRKKLEFDPNLKIVAIRGKGYKLEITA